MNQLTAVKTRYPLTYFTWPYRGLRCRPIEVEYFLEVIRWQVTSFQMIADSSLFISNSLPTNVDICSSVIITWSVCYSACAKVLCFTLTNKHGRWTEADVLSSTVFCVIILSAPRKKDGESGTKTQNRQGFVWCWGYWSGYDAKTAENAFRGFSHEYDEWRDYDNERNYFPFVRLEKMFFRAEGLLVAWPSGQKPHFF